MQVMLSRVTDRKLLHIVGRLQPSMFVPVMTPNGFAAPAAAPVV